jgi:hypothetical protein
MKEEDRRVDDAYYYYLEVRDISFYLTFLPKGRFQILETVGSIFLGLKPFVLRFRPTETVRCLGTVICRNYHIACAETITLHVLKLSHCMC